MTQTQPKTAHKYNKGTVFVFFGLLLLAIAIWGVVTGSGNSPLGLIGLVLLIVGIARKRENR
ncbi:MAG TPA: hypothetical protein DEV93_02895 [Chloroflexi bacterium]|jgi:C4-dicarboxylate transporter|nr:hypothetical protein [Chloroflexota bacterium]